MRSLDLTPATPLVWPAPSNGTSGRLIVLSMGWGNWSRIALQALLAAYPKLTELGDWAAVDHLRSGYELKTEAAQVRTYAEKFGYGEIVVVGASMGAGLLPALDDLRVNIPGAVLIDPVLTALSLRFTRWLMALGAYVMAYASRKFWERFSGSMPDIEAVAQEAARSHRGYGLALHGSVRRAQSAALLQFGKVSRFNVRHRTTRVRVMSSEHDDAVRANYNASLLSRIYGRYFVGRMTISGTYHQSLVEHPGRWGAALYTALLNLLSR